MTLEDQIVNMQMNVKQLQENTDKVMTAQQRAMRKYLESNRELLSHNARKNYYENTEYRQRKKMLSAIKRYENDKVSVSNRIVDELREYFKKTDNEMPYKRKGAHYQ